ncbi:hypothetical protein Bbelb_128980 [Branchiostoma belcheri]|nr:hypothetical protein Bbelb_128980 [Branchiostoma belcheri]
MPSEQQTQHNFHTTYTLHSTALQIPLPSAAKLTEKLQNQEKYTAMPQPACLHVLLTFSPKQIIFPPSAERTQLPAEFYTVATLRGPREGEFYSREATIPLGRKVGLRHLKCRHEDSIL